MEQINIIGLDIAKNVFQADVGGAVLLRKKLPRGGVIDFFSSQLPSLVALEACGEAHHWAREIAKLGDTVRLIAPKRAEVCEAVRKAPEE